MKLVPGLGNSLRNVFKIVAAVATVAAVSATATAVLQPQTRSMPFTETASISTSSSAVGIADSDLYKMSPDDVNHTLDLVKATGVNSVRLLFPWAGMEPDSGVFDWGQTDLMVGAANARGLSVVGTLVSSPGWAIEPGLIPISSPPASAAAFADFAGAVAAHYRGRVAAYEVWNEPNGVLSWTSGPQGPEPARYVELMKATYPKIKAGDGSAIVIGGALGAVISFGALSVDPVAYLNQMYAAGAKGSFDALSFHPYQYSTMFSQGGGLGNSPINQLGAMRQTMVANGDGGKKIWATEYGEPTSAVDEPTQAAYLTDFLNTWRGLSYAGPAYVYTTRDRNTGGGTEDTFGLYRSDWTPKPAQAAVAALA